jgi:hypothetical protein
LNRTLHTNLVDFMKVENPLAKEKYDLLEELNYFEQL